MAKDLCCQQGFSVWARMCALSKDFESKSLSVYLSLSLSLSKDFDCGQGSVLSARIFCLVGKDVCSEQGYFESTIRTCALFLERICGLSKDFVVL